MARVCIFCEGPVNSREHVWPAWTLKLVYPELPIGGYKGARPIWVHGPNASIQVRHLCRVHCNGGWMSRLEETAKPAMEPLIHDVKSLINKTQQELIARWATKTAMVFECIGDPGPTNRKFFRQDERRALMEHQSIPKDTAIWVGRFTGELSPTSAGVRIGGNAKESKDIGMYFTITVGSLMIQMLTLRQDEKRTVRVTQNPKIPWHFGMYQIWPIIVPAVPWPPPLSFGDDPPCTLKTLVERFWPNAPPHPLWGRTTR